MAAHIHPQGNAPSAIVTHGPEIVGTEVSESRLEKGVDLIGAEQRGDEVLSCEYPARQIRTLRDRVLKTQKFHTCAPGGGLTDTSGKPYKFSIAVGGFMGES